jgi:hypothetical protein
VDLLARLPHDVLRRREVYVAAALILRDRTAQRLVAITLHSGWLEHTTRMPLTITVLGADERTLYSARTIVKSPGIAFGDLPGGTVLRFLKSNVGCGITALRRLIIR